MENEINITTEEFLTDLYGSLDTPIYFNVAGKTWKHKPQSYMEAKDTLQWRNEQGDDIYYIVNSGGTTDDQITLFRSAFIDWDCGKDEQGNYFPMDTVSTKKQEFMSHLSTSPCQPTYIIETRNGYHGYWFLSDNPSSEQYKDIQKRLSSYFHADPSIINPARVMRLPNYYWYKSAHLCIPFFVSIYHKSDVVYKFSDLVSSFPSVYDSNSYCSEWSEGQRFGAQDNSFYYKDNTRSIYLGTYPPLPSEDPVVVKTYKEGIEFIKQQNIAEYLKRTGHITLEKMEYQSNDKIYMQCPFHNDNSPSANVYRREEDGIYYFKCHSKNCGYGPSTIIDVVQKISRASQADTLKMLFDYYHVTLDERWKNDYKEILDNNIAIITHLEEHQEQYPCLYKYIHKIKGDLISKLKFAQDHIALQSTQGEPLFICSLVEFERARTGLYIEDCGRQNERVDRYCLLGLMRKLPDDEITKGILANAYEQRRRIQKTRQVKNMARTQIYTIPEYTEELLAKAEITARQMKEQGIRMNSISSDVVYEIFGDNKAKEIYPQKNTSGLTAGGKQFQAQVESILLEEISIKGYSRIAGIVESLKQHYDWGRVTDRRVKKYIPGLLIKHGLVEVYADAGLKKSLNIEFNGFPKIIIKRVV